MKLTICASNNQPFFSLGAHLYRLNSINKQPPSLAADIFYAMYQAVIPKASPEEISLGSGLIVAGILASFGINNNKIIAVI